MSSHHKTVKVVYVPPPTTPVGKKSQRSIVLSPSRNNQIAPRSVFTCIDEVYSPPNATHPVGRQTSLPLYMSSQQEQNKPNSYRQWLLTSIIIVIIVCIIVIVVLLAIFLTH